MMVEKKWGRDAAQLYKFTQSSEQVRQNFIEAMDTYIKSLPDKEFEEFEQEIAIAKEFILDLQNVELKASHKLIKY